MATVGPNFPASLAIAPNAPRGAEDAVGWQQDSHADIAAYGIAGRIW